MVENPLIELVKGDARDQKAIDLLVGGCNMVMSMLGQPKGEASIFSDATKISAVPCMTMESEGIL